MGTENRVSTNGGAVNNKCGGHCMDSVAYLVVFVVDILKNEVQRRASFSQCFLVVEVWDEVTAWIGETHSDEASNH